MGRAPLNITLPDALLDRWPSLDLSADQSPAAAASSALQSPAGPRRRARLIDRLWLVLCVSTLALIACDRRRHRTLRRLIMQFASMYLLRCLTLPWTILPKTDPHCQNEVHAHAHTLAKTHPSNEPSHLPYS